MVSFGMRGEFHERVQRARRRRFEQLVIGALGELPEHVQSMLDNVDIVVEDEPSTEETTGDETLFGLYQGVPLTDRNGAYSMVLPDKITIFRGPIERSFANRREIARQVRITVLHELAHHFGIDEDRLAELGLA